MPTKLENPYYDQLNSNGTIFQLFEIPKDLYTFHVLRNNMDEDTSHRMEA